MLKPDTRGAAGELLPIAVYSKMPAIALEDPGETYKKLRVVGIRVDPCFPLTPPAVGCQPQIRMVWQPIERQTDEIYRAIDAAVHSFYDLTNAEFKELISQLEALKTKYGIQTTNEVLGVNPLLKQLGLGSDYARELFSILLTKAGEKRLSQATFMQLEDEEDSWTFGGFEISNSRLTPLLIHRVEAPRQKVTNKPLIFVSNYYAHASIVPAPQGKDTFNLLVSESRDIGKEQEAQVAESVMSIYRIENPTRHNPTNVDCASCHVAQAARLWATRQFPWLMLDLQGGMYQFKSSYNLTNSSPFPFNTRMLRAFGYGNTDPAISQRVVNETAAVLERLYPVTAGSTGTKLER